MYQVVRYSLYFMSIKKNEEMRGMMINLIVPIYNIEQYLIRCLESIARQTSKNFTAILVNDGSTDRCREICEKFIEGDARFILLNKANGGLSSAVKYGIMNSPKCEYYMFLDGDDALEPNAIEVVVQVLNGKKYDMIMYDHYVDTPSSVRVISSNLVQKEYCNEEMIKLKNEYQTNANIIPARWNKVFCSEAVKKLLPFYDINVTIAEDVLFSTIGFFCADSMYYIKRPLIHYYQNQGSMVHVYKESYFQSYKLVYQNLSAFFKNDNIIPNRIFFQNVKTCIQSVILNIANWKSAKEILRTISDDSTVFKVLGEFVPASITDKILKVLIEKKYFFVLRILTKINNRG